MKKIIPFVIAGIAIILIGIGGYYYFNSSNNSKNDDFVLHEYKNYEDNINDLNNYMGYLYPIDDIDKVDIQDILYFIYMNVEDDNRNTSFTAEEVNSLIAKYFGNDFKYENTDILEPFGGKSVRYQYDATKQLYLKTTDGSDVDNFARSKFYVLDKSYDKNTKNIIIKAKILYCDYADDYYGSIYRYYLSYNDSKNKENIIYTIDPNSNDEGGKFDEVYEKVKDKLPVYTYTLIKDGAGNYAIKSITRE